MKDNYKLKNDGNMIRVKVIDDKGNYLFMFHVVHYTTETDVFFSNINNTTLVTRRLGK